MNPLALQLLIVASSVPESWLEPSLSKWPLASSSADTASTPQESASMPAPTEPVGPTSGRE